MIGCVADEVESGTKVRPLTSAPASASKLMIASGNMLTRIAVGFMRSSSAAPIMPCDAWFSGSVTAIASDLLRSSGRSTAVAAGRSRRLRGHLGTRHFFIVVVAMAVQTGAAPDTAERGCGRGPRRSSCRRLLTGSTPA